MKTKRVNALSLLRLMFVAILVAIAVPAGAETISVPFSSDSNLDSYDLVLNPALGYAHPPLEATGWNNGAVGTPIAISLGDGRHGSFNSNTYLNFHEGTYAGDFTIRINTDTYPDLQFTDFTLDAGWTLQPTGSKPLTIRSLSFVKVYGTIDCSGEDGVTQQAPGSATTPAGGRGRCGGGDGGKGGNASAVSFLGLAGSKTSTGIGDAGDPGPAAGDGGGGGAGLRQDWSNAEVGDGIQFGSGPAPFVYLDNRGDGVLAGNEDSIIAVEGGGAGGGGGSGHDPDGDGADATDSTGGGGGAGGGSIYIYAGSDVNVYSVGLVTGTITANGGDGGGDLGRGNGGGGGGGAGGTILIHAGGAIDFAGPVTADAGTGGASDGDGAGGDGGEGRTWIIGSTGFASGTAESPVTLLVAEGSINYRGSAGTPFAIVSDQFDLLNTAPVLQSVSTDATIPAGSSVTVQVASSDVPFAVADAVWVDSASLSSVSGKRYLRIRVLVDSASASSPVLLRSLQLNYQLTDKTQFNFASCGRVAQTPIPPGMSFCLLLLPLFAAWMLRGHSKSYSRARK